MAFRDNNEIIGVAESFDEDLADINDILTTPGRNRHQYARQRRERSGAADDRGAAGEGQEVHEIVDFIEHEVDSVRTEDHAPREGERRHVASPLPSVGEEDDVNYSGQEGEQQDGPNNNNNEAEEECAFASRRKKTKTRSGPQRPLSAYNIFFRDYRVQLVKNSRDGSVPFATMGKKVGEKWQSLTGQERKFWEEKAEVDNQRYQEELHQYKARIKKRKLSTEAAVVIVRGEEQGRNASSTGATSNRMRHTAEWQETGVEASRNSARAATVSFQTIPFHAGTPQEKTARRTPGGVFSGASSFLEATMAPPPARRIVSLQGNDLLGVLQEGELPEGCVPPGGLPPSGSEISWPDSTGQVIPHIIRWNVYSVKSSQVEAFMEQIMAQQQQQQAPPRPSKPAAPPANTFPSSASQWQQHPSSVSGATSASGNYHPASVSGASAAENYQHSSVSGARTSENYQHCVLTNAPQEYYQLAAPPPFDQTHYQGGTFWA